MGRNVQYQRPWLYPKQREAIFDCVDINGKASRYAFIEASTKAGKTSACIAWLFEKAIVGKKGQNFWWVAPVYTQAKIAFRRMKDGVPKTLYVANESELFIRLANGATIWFKSAEKPDNLYGDDVHAAVIDEASRAREEAWHAIRSTLTATKGPIRAIGNVKGRKNWFFKLARIAEAGAEGMSHAKLNAWDAVAGGVLDKAEIEDARRLLPENVFKELYLAEASDDEGNPFGFKHITACTAELSENPPVAIGVDLAKSVDWTVVVGIDKDGVVCGLERWQHVPWGETTARLKGLIGGYPATVDSTGVGDPIVEDLQTECYGVRGFQFTSPTKQRLMEGLALAIQSHQIKFPPGPIKQELELFEYVFTRTGVRYSAPDGYHDDCVMALALAVDRWREVMPLGLSGMPVEVDRISPWLDNFTAQGEPL
ncbi:Terminase-like family [uncultured Caudovirales phage]|uniref:Terminase-like family n=1 Tax=uncultured Caudovirales phage TaxID=2100421 RepID=A0A6J7WQH9_9CAUD|nr:Terminase-like family [uncultured Caudovirales phage]